MNKRDIEDAVIFNAEEIAQEIFDAEWNRRVGSSPYQKGGK